MAYELRLNREAESISVGFSKRKEFKPWVLDEPYVPQADRGYIEAFLELGTARNWNGQIPITAIAMYADNLGLPRGAGMSPARTFEMILLAMDRHWPTVKDGNRAEDPTGGDTKTRNRLIRRASTNDGPPDPPKSTPAARPRTMGRRGR